MAAIEPGRFRDPRDVGMRDLIGESPGMMLLRQQITHLLHRQSPSRRLPTLLIQGETGTGKGLLARAVHNASARFSQPFINTDCLAIPETLLEAELFGFERGAFTDAKQSKLGLFHAASGGSIFLDEVGLLPRTFQAKLLKVVDERRVRRLGSTRVDVMDVWVMAATNVDLATATREGAFREDLYHRLAAMTLFMPPLRERGGDILLLAEHYLGRACAEYHLPLKVLTAEARAALLAYAWPGNVRELANMLERVALLSGDVSIITPDLLGLHPPAGPVRGVREPERSQLKASVEGFEREELRAALLETGWNVSLAAVRLGLPRNTLRYRIAKLQLHPGKAGTVLAPGRKPPGKIGERSRKVGPGGAVTVKGKVSTVRPRTSHAAGPSGAVGLTTSSKVRWSKSVRRFCTTRSAPAQTTVAPMRLAPERLTGIVVPWPPLGREVEATSVVWPSPLSRVICRRLPTAS